MGHDLKEQGPVFLCCTTSLGAGMDIRDVTAVIQVGLSDNMLDMLQSSGRGGRNGEAFLSYTIPWIKFPRKPLEDPDHCGALVLREWALSPICRRSGISEFMDGTIKACWSITGATLCDNCDHPRSAKLLIPSYDLNERVWPPVPVSDVSELSRGMKRKQPMAIHGKCLSLSGVVLWAYLSLFPSIVASSASLHASSSSVDPPPPPRPKPKRARTSIATGVVSTVEAQSTAHSIMTDSEVQISRRRNLEKQKNSLQSLFHRVKGCCTICMGFGSFAPGHAASGCPRAHKELRYRERIDDWAENVRDAVKRTRFEPRDQICFWCLLPRFGGYHEASQSERFDRENCTYKRGVWEMIAIHQKSRLPCAKEKFGWPSSFPLDKFALWAKQKDDNGILNMFAYIEWLWSIVMGNDITIQL